jgi:hypothetical protein
MRTTVVATVLAIALALSALGQTTQSVTASGDSMRYPMLIRAEIPLYPPAAWSAHLGGKIEIEVTVEKGAVVDAQVKHGTIELQSGGEKSAVSENQIKLLPYLSLPSVANVKTWQFEPGHRATLIITYVYQIEGEQTLRPENPKIELDLPRAVKVTARPFKPSRSD